MSRFSPTELRDALGSGLLSFPVTHTDAELNLDEEGLRSHLRTCASSTRPGCSRPAARASSSA